MCGGYVAYKHFQLVLLKQPKEFILQNRVCVCAQVLDLMNI